MTQPEQAPQPDGGHGEIIAPAAIGLALLAVETRTKQEVEDTISDAYKLIAATAIALAATQPGVILTGLALLAMPSMHAAITKNLGQAREDVADTIDAGYTAAAQLALTKATADLKAHDYQVPQTLPELGDNIDRILQDVDTMFAQAQTDIQNSIVDAYDGITGDNHTAARTVAINQAMAAARARTNQRALAAAATGVHQGSTDAQQAIYNEYQNTDGGQLLKRWRTTSNTPCGMCDALNGTTVGINSEFDHNATTEPADWRRVWRNLTGPPRHPNCRCQIDLIRV